MDAIHSESPAWSTDNHKFISQQQSDIHLLRYTKKGGYAALGYPFNNCKSRHKKTCFFVACDQVKLKRPCTD